ncbi:protein TSSC4 [Contarinia nasturtii]|uniref:protein TSSC4 n=1 Tax=Contarinia nasturtii TaxID=265458 RepID=UPI0012D395B0|nr:protein TSSC4 [Contarinia nasturtii]
MSLNYEDKKKMLFECLNSAEKCIQGTSLDQRQFTRDEPKQQDDSKALIKGRRFQGKESIFKRPAAPISKCLRPRRLPDYQMNPHKWKKYSLDDADISDKTNTSAAFAFLAEIERRKDMEEEKRARENEMDCDDDSSSGKIVFKKRTSSVDNRKPSFNQSTALRKEIEESDDRNESDAKAVLKGSKVIMPEYVIGQKIQKKVNKKLNATSTANTQQSDGKNKPHLQHLFDEEDED